MNSKDAKICKIYLWAIIICMTGFFGFTNYLPLSGAIYYNDYILIGIFIVSLIFGIRQVISNCEIYLTKSFFGLSAGLVFILFVEIIWTYLRYHQPIVLTVKESFYYLVPLFAYFVVCQYRRDCVDIETFGNMFVKASILSSAVAILVFILFTGAGINLLQLSISEESYRNGTLRFSVGGIVLYVGFIISLIRLLNHKAGRMDRWNLILVAIQLIVIDKTRSTMLYFIILILISVLFEKKVNTICKWFMVLGIVLCFIAIIFSAGMLSEHLVGYVNADDGIMIRFNTIKFYMSQFMDVPILGMGLISASRDVDGWQLLYGKTGNFYRDDVGMVGFLNKFGICGLVWVISFWAVFYKKCRKLHNINATIILYIDLFLMITSINLMFMDPQRVMYIFILFTASKFLQNDVYDSMDNTRKAGGVYDFICDQDKQ